MMILITAITSCRIGENGSDAVANSSMDDNSSISSDQEQSLTDDNNATSTSIDGVTGKITTTDGTPVNDALVSPLSLSGGIVPEIAILSKEDGTYEWPLKQGKYEITVTAQGFNPQTKQINVTSQGVFVLDFVLNK